MNADVKEISINGISYIPKDSIQEPAVKVDNMEYCIVRTYSAGVFIGYIQSRKDKEVKMLQARRIWYWSGAASLSQLAIEGSSKPKECKIAMPIEVILTEAIEIISVTQKAKNNIDGIPQWKI
jgi:hypothetical protein